jgi:hypothetical protein
MYRHLITTRHFNLRRPPGGPLKLFSAGRAEAINEAGF